MGYKVTLLLATLTFLFTGLLLGYLITQLFQGAISANLLTFISTVSLVVIFGALFYALLRELRRQRHQLSLLKNKSVYQSPLFAIPPNTSDRASSQHRIAIPPEEYLIPPENQLSVTSPFWGYPDTPETQVGTSTSFLEYPPILETPLDAVVAIKFEETLPDSELHNRLMTMLAGDTAACSRLIEQAKQEHPGYEESWYLEKVIEDLERDRR